MKERNKILNETEIKYCQKLVLELTAGHQSLNDSAKLGGKYLASWKTATRHPSNWSGNYFVLTAEDSAVVQKLLKINREIAIGYFLYKAKYIGDDHLGCDHHCLNINSSKLRMAHPGWELIIIHKSQMATKFERWPLNEKW